MNTEIENCIYIKFYLMNHSHRVLQSYPFLFSLIPKHHNIYYYYIFDIAITTKKRVLKIGGQ